jgi:hypothetical protein
VLQHTSYSMPLFWSEHKNRTIHLRIISHINTWEKKNQVPWQSFLVWARTIRDHVLSRLWSRSHLLTTSTLCAWDDALTSSEPCRIRARMIFLSTSSPRDLRSSNHAEVNRSPEEKARVVVRQAR